MTELPARVPLTPRDLGFMRALRQASQPDPEPRSAAAEWHSPTGLIYAGHLAPSPGAAALHHLAAPLVRRGLIRRHRLTGVTCYQLTAVGLCLLGSLTGPDVEALVHVGQSVLVDCYAEVSARPDKFFVITKRQGIDLASASDGEAPVTTFRLSVRRATFGEIVAGTTTIRTWGAPPPEAVRGIVGEMLAEGGPRPQMCSSPERRPHDTTMDLPIGELGALAALAVAGRVLDPDSWYTTGDLAAAGITDRADAGLANIALTSLASKGLTVRDPLQTAPPPRWRITPAGREVLATSACCEPYGSWTAAVEASLAGMITSISGVAEPGAVLIAARAARHGLVTSTAVFVVDDLGDHTAGTSPGAWSATAPPTRSTCWGGSHEPDLG